MLSVGLCAGPFVLSAWALGRAGYPLTSPVKRKVGYFLLIAVLTGCTGEKGSLPNPEAGSPSFQTAPVQFRTVAADLMLSASVQPDPARIVHIFAPVSGRLIALQVKAGDTVHSGDSVAIIQSSDAASARSDYEKAKAQSERSEAALRRASLLYEHHVVAAKDVEEVTAQAASDKSDLERTRERLELLGLGESALSDKVSVRAPRSGVVIETTSATGEFSKSLDASNPLLTVADLSSVWVIGSSYEQDLESIVRGAPVVITTDAYPSLTWRSQIAYVSDVVDPNTRTVKVRVILNNPDRKLKPEMFASIRVSRPERRVAVVPSIAVLHEGNETFVIVQKDKTSFLKRRVQVEKTGQQETVLRSGLQPGDMIVTSGAEFLREEAK